MSCTYRSVTLQPGESYVLPAGAELVFVSDDTQLTATNDCATIPVTQLVCYKFRAILADDDVDDSLEMYVTGLDLDGLSFGINPAFTTYGVFGTSTGSTNAESATGYVTRLGSNIWYQFPLIPDASIVQGLRVTYTDADQSGGDMTDIFIVVPDIFTNVYMQFTDTNTQNAPYLVKGEKTCDPPPGVDGDFQIGIFP